MPLTQNTLPILTKLNPTEIIKIIWGLWDFIVVHKECLFAEIWPSDPGDEEYCSLGCDVMQSG
jgi:hypothetical protein